MLYLFRYIAISIIISVFSLVNASNKKAAIVIDFTDNQKVLFSENATAKRHPASLTKVMTVYLLLEAIREKKISFDTKFKVSRLASIQMPSKLGLKVGEKIKVIDAIKALAVKSANDVAVVVAEGMCGSVANFCSLMNKTARRLGMNDTHFENPSGVPNQKQITTAKDMALLEIAVFKHFPQYWYLFSLKSFSYQGANHGTHCKILHWYKGADGAKTGYIAASGFNLMVTANKYNKEGKNRRLFVVVMGGATGKSRDLQAAKLMDQYFGEYKIFTNNAPKPAVEKTYPEKKPLSKEKLSKAEEVDSTNQAVDIQDAEKETSPYTKHLDKLYEHDEDVIQIEEETFVDSTKVSKPSKRSKHIKKYKRKRSYSRSKS